VLSRHPDVWDIVEAQTGLIHKHGVGGEVEDDVTILKPVEVDYPSYRKELWIPTADHGIPPESGVAVSDEEALNLLPSLDIAQPSLCRRAAEKLIK
jgi:hypothetical protein